GTARRGRAPRIALLRNALLLGAQLRVKRAERIVEPLVKPRATLVRGLSRTVRARSLRAARSAARGASPCAGRVRLRRIGRRSAPGGRCGRRRAPRPAPLAVPGPVPRGRGGATRREQDRAGNGGGAGDVGADAARGFRLLDVPDGRLVTGFLFPPAETDATGRARRGAAGDAAAAVGLAAAAVHPDDVTHVRCGNLLRESRPGQQLLD